MKKEYMKPAISVELFTMSQSIADNCGHNLDWTLATLKYRGDCGWDLMPGYDPGDKSDILFLNGQSACGAPVAEDGFEGVCYNNPDGGYNVFNS